MDQGSKKLAIILGIALLLGAIVVALNPSYRRAFFSIARGQPNQSPIWQSNIDYYPDITLPVSEASDGATSESTHNDKPE